MAGRVWVMRGVIPFILVLFLAACTDGPPSEAVEVRENDPPQLEACAASAWAAPEVSVLGSRLDTPWGFAPTEDGRIFLTERSGQVRVVDGDGLQSEPWATLPVSSRGESGLLGLALPPDFAQSGHVYVAGTYASGGSMGLLARAWRRAIRTLGGTPDPGLALRVFRLGDGDGRAGDPELVVDGLPAGPLHSGGAILFADDNDSNEFLLTLGDSREPWSAQDPSDPRGSILEVTIPPEGRAARFGSGVEIVAAGVRNSQGLARLPGAGAVAFIEHGPTGAPDENFRLGKDELNILTPDANYGWPMEAGFPDAPRHEPPVAEWHPAIAPAGLAVLARNANAAARADLFVTGLRGRTLRRIEMHRSAASGWTPACEEVVLDQEFGRLRAIAPHPDGGLLVGTSNRDGRGLPDEGDDRLLHVRPSSLGALSTAASPASEGSR